MSTEMGALAAALAKAQSAFPPVVKDKHVTIEKKSGGSYSFDYAPLDSILEATRQPLADNGIALVQMLDEGTLITSILHEGGGVISGRIDLPPTEDIKGLGSAITYLRRYAIQAALGIAAEDDDDGSGANGDGIKYDSRPRPRATAPVVPAGPALWSGPVSKGQTPVDGNLRETPTGAAFGFALTDQGGKRVQILALGDLAHALAIACADGLPTEATVDGELVMVPWEKDGKKMPPYRRVIASRINTPEWTLPAAGVAPAAPQRESQAAIDAELDGLDF